MGKRSVRQKRAAEARGRNNTGSSFRLTVMTCGVTAFVIVVLLYIPALKNNFVNWDDGLYVYENSSIRSLSLESSLWMLTSFYATNWHPLTWLSHAADYALFGLNPGGHHLTSIIIHGLNTLLVLLLSIQLSLKAQALNKVPASSAENLSTPFKAVIAGCVTALLFGVHPLHVESVAWVAERKDVLCAFFFLLTLLSYCFFVSAAAKKKRGVWFTACMALAAAALMAKPMAVTLPFILLLLDIYPLKRISFPEGTDQNPGVLLEKIPFFLLSGISIILTILAQHAGGAFESLERLPIHFRLANALYTPLFYLGKMFWPAKLVPYYPFPKTIHFFDLAYYCIAVILVFGVTGWCIWLWKRRRYLLFITWAYFLITLLPVVGITQVGSQMAADRYTYLPSVSLFLLAGVGVSQLFAKFAVRKNIMIAGGAFAVLVFAALGQRTITQIAIWQDSESLWQYVIKSFPGRVPVAHNNLGVLYDGKGLHDKALEEYEKAVAINPTFADAHSNLGVAYKRKGNHDKAIEEYEKALAGNPNLVEARNNLGLAYYHQGMYDKAVEEYEKVLEINPAFAEAHYKLGLTYYEKKNYALAKIHLGKAQKLGYKVDEKIAELINQAP